MSAIDDIREAAGKRAKAKSDLKAASGDLREACVQAKAEGVPITQIARDAGLSRQGVYDLLSERPSP
jgi:DNA-binding phage protein